MSDTEFGEQAASIAAQIPELPSEDRIAAACRGSGNPVALAWLAENLQLNESATVVDLGAGLGGPAEWMRARYQCTVIAVEPEPQAAAAGSSLFALPTSLVIARDGRICARHVGLPPMKTKEPTVNDVKELFAAAIKPLL
jgi:hypothetical protein